MKIQVVLSILLFFTGSFAIAQDQEVPKPEVVVNLGWGAMESEYDFKGSLLLSAELQVTYKTNFFSVRSLFVNDNDYGDRKLQSHSFLYGYIEDFGMHNIYLASGVSLNQFKETIEVLDGPDEKRDYSVIGVPLNAGFSVMLSERMGMNAQAFYNFNTEDNFIGYYVAFRTRIY